MESSEEQRWQAMAGGSTEVAFQAVAEELERSSSMPQAEWVVNWEQRDDLSW